jgi:hypothetical protein
VYLNLLSVFEEDTISGWLLRAKAYWIRFGPLSPLCSHTTGEREWWSILGTLGRVLTTARKRRNDKDESSYSRGLHRVQIDRS